MAKINSIQCSTTLKNTGICDCIFDPKLITGGIFVPPGTVLTQAQIDAIQATLEGLVQAPKGSRIFPFQGFVAVVDNTEEPTFQTFGYGTAEPVREGRYNWVFQFRSGGLILSNNLRSFNNAKYDVIFIESQNTLIGTRKKDVNGADGLAGVPQEAGYPYTYPWKVNDGTNLAAYRTQFVFQPVYINENIAFAKIPSTTYLLSELAGLQNVLIEIVEVAGDTVTVKLFDDCGKDLYEDFADEFANEEAWILKDPDGTVLAISSAVKNTDVDGWDITGPGTIEDGSTIELSAPTVLAAPPVNVEGYESEVKVIEVGS